MKTTDSVCPRVVPHAGWLAARRRMMRRWLVSGALLLLVPKCAVCLVGYLGIIAGIGGAGGELCGGVAGDNSGLTVWAGVFLLPMIFLGIFGDRLLKIISARRRAFVRNGTVQSLNQ